MKKKFFSAALAAAMVVTSVFSTTSVAGAAENETAVPYGKVTVEQKDNTVTIGNDAIKRTVTRAKDVTAAVVDIIGLDYNQFSQIAMIAQGQFTRLLNASTEERSKIFRKLFRTQPDP